ncbi:MAG: ABC transporter substrate binding protein [Gallionellaceae bacterium]
MSKIIKQWLVILFLLLTISLLTWFKITQPRILVLHSYNTDYSWTRDIDIGIKRVFDSNLHYKVQWHYMDTKKHPDENFKRRAGKLARHEIENYHPDLIIAVDDDAHKYAVKSYANDPGVTIIFAGINGPDVKPYGYDKANNVTGIYERKPLESLRIALSEIRGKDNKPLGKRIFFIGDKSSSVIEDSKQIKVMDWSPFRMADLQLVSTFAEWKQLVAEADQKADLIVIENFQNISRRQGGKEMVPPIEIMQWTEKHSTIPVVGMGGYMVEEGGMLAIGASGFEQGDVIARMAVKILDYGVKAKDIKQVMPHQYLVYMRDDELKKHELSLPDIYEAFSRASNNHY